MNTDAGSRWTRRGVRLASFLALVTIFVFPPIGTIPRALASATCSFDPEKRIVTTEGSPARLSVGSGGVIHVDDHTCDYVPFEGSSQVADMTNTDIVQVNGTPSIDTVTIDQTGDGGAFPDEMQFALALGEDPGDILDVVLTSELDIVHGDLRALYLNAERSGGLGLRGVDEVEVDAGDGNDLIDAGDVDGDSGIGVTVSDPGPLELPITVRGGDGDDVIIGGEADDHLYGYGGADVLAGGEGTDVLIGGDGTDFCVYTTGKAGCDPVIVLGASRARAGAQIVASGSGWFPENGPISITFGSTPAGDVQPLGNGSFTTDSLHVPAGESTTEVTSCQQCGKDPSNDAPSVPFEYESAPVAVTLDVDPDEVPQGERVFVSGSGWTPEEDVLILVGAEEVARGIVGGDFGFETSFVAEDLPLGTHTLVACQACGGEGERRAEQSFLVVEGPPIIEPTSNDQWTGWAGILIALAAAALLVRRLIRRWPPRVRTHLSDPGVQVSVTTVGDGSADHIVRLVPKHDPGVQDLEEVRLR
jgi:hypothetical protein